MNWLLASQAFLLTCLAVAATSEVNLDFLQSLSKTVIVVGFGHSLFAIISITTAISTSGKLLPLQGKVDEKLKRLCDRDWSNLGARKQRKDWNSVTLGRVSDFCTPVLLLWAWIAIAIALAKDENVFQNFELAYNYRNWTNGLEE